MNQKQEKTFIKILYQLY